MYKLCSSSVQALFKLYCPWPLIADHWKIWLFPIWMLSVLHSIDAATFPKPALMANVGRFINLGLASSFNWQPSCMEKFNVLGYPNPLDKGTWQMLYMTISLTKSAGQGWKSSRLLIHWFELFCHPDFFLFAVFQYKSMGWRLAFGKIDLT